MAFILKNRIFEYFGVNSKLQDTYKDVYGKGIKERHQESIGEDYDDELGPLVDLFMENTLLAQTMLSRMIPYLEDSLGNPVVVANDVAMRRRVLRFAHQIYNIKSTLLSYQVMFRMMGFDTVTVEELADGAGFDSDLTFDDTLRTFDSVERTCSDYSIHLTGTINITQEVYDAVYRVLEFLEPINADIREVTYNGVAIAVEGIFDDSFDKSFG